MLEAAYDAKVSQSWPHFVPLHYLYLNNKCPIHFTSEVNSSQTSSKTSVNLSEICSCDEFTV